MTMIGPAGARATHLVDVQSWWGHTLTLFVRLSVCVGPSFVSTVCQRHTHHAHVEFGGCGSNNMRLRNKTLVGLRQTQKFVQGVAMLWPKQVGATI